jgi:hypothetical protein
MLSTEQILRCLSDEVTPVRDTDARLLGCIPRIQDDNAVLVTGTNGQNFELRIATTVCVCVDLKTHDPSTLPDFVPLDMKNADIGTPLVGEGAAPGEDPDLAQPL